MAKSFKLTDRQAIIQWEEFRLNLDKATTIDIAETEAEKLKRIAALEASPEDWFAYYFPNYYSARPAQFHKKATKRLFKNNRWYEVRAWSRELAKSTRAMMEFTNLAMRGLIKNVILVSNSYDNAERLLLPFKINFESNNRLRNDYGEQVNPGKWEAGEFTTRKGCAFRALGAGQSPRGSKNEEARPDAILVDDIDTDEETRSKKRIQTKWEWIEQALIPTVSVSGNYRILFLGNIIAKDCCITRAMKMADHTDVINIRDNNGKSSWIEKNSETDVDDILSRVSYMSAQKEYFNNPITEGTVFKDITWGEVPDLRQFRFLVAYGDPSPSNKENKDGSFKALPLIGEHDGKFYILTAFLEQAHNHKFITWFYDIEEWSKNSTVIYNYIENNSLQDPFYEQVLSPLFITEGAARQHYIHIIPDERKKPDKFARIEGNLEPLNRQGRLIFNINEIANPHMQRLADQFKALDPQLSAHADGPDAVEGGVWVINNKNTSMAPMKLGVRKIHKKRF